MAAHVGQLAPRKPSSASLNAFGCLRVLKEASAGAGRAGDAQPVVEVDRAEGINPTSARRPPPPELEARLVAGVHNGGTTGGCRQAVTWGETSASLAVVA